MCISPIRILNKSKSFNPAVDKAYLEVPCGHCWQCVKKKANDWFLRASYEFVDTVGDTLFPTLTYNDAHLHHIDLTDDKWKPLIDEVGFHVPAVNKRITCFDKRDITKFNKSFRQYLDKSKSYHWIENDLTNYFYKFFSVCELGTDNHRPHVHCLLHMDHEIMKNVSVFNDINKLLQLAWSESVDFKDLPLDLQLWINTNEDIIHKKGYVIPEHLSYDYIIYSVSGKLWYMHRYGFVSWPQNKDGSFRPVLESCGGAKYVSKYLTKMFIFDKEDKFSAVKSFLSKCRPYEGDYKDLYKDLRASLPFVHASKGYGRIIEDKVIANVEKGDYDNAIMINPPGDHQHTYGVPTYIINRLFYQKQQYDKDLSYTLLTPLGFKLYAHRLYSVVNFIKETVNLLNNNLYIVFFHSLDPEDVKIFRGYSNICNHDLFAMYCLCFENCPDATRYVRTHLSDIELLVRDFLHEKSVVHSCDPGKLYDRGWFDSVDTDDIKMRVTASNSSKILYDYGSMKLVYDKILKSINKELSSSQISEDELKYITKLKNSMTYV